MEKLKEIKDWEIWSDEKENMAKQSRDRERREKRKIVLLWKTRGGRNLISEIHARLSYADMAGKFLPLFSSALYSSFPLSFSKLQKYPF